MVGKSLGMSRRKMLEPYRYGNKLRIYSNNNKKPFEAFNQESNMF